MADNENHVELQVEDLNNGSFPGLKVGDVIKISPGGRSELGEIDGVDFLLVSMKDSAAGRLSFEAADKVAALTTREGEMGVRVSRRLDGAVDLEVVSPPKDRR